LHGRWDGQVRMAGISHEGTIDAEVSLPPVGRQQVTVAVDTRGTWDNGETSQGWQGVVEVDASGRLDRAVEIGLTLPRFTWTRGGERIPLNGLHARATVTPQLVKLDELAVP